MCNEEAWRKAHHELLLVNYQTFKKVFVGPSYWYPLFRILDDSAHEFHNKGGFIYHLQWRIQDFPLGGHRHIGVADRGFLAEMCLKMKELGPFGGEGHHWIRQCGGM